MQIKCEQCKTEYSLDEKLLSPKGTPVRCTNCGKVFKAFPPSSGAAASAVAANKPRGQGVTAQAKNTTRQPTMSGAAARVSEVAPKKKPLHIRPIPSQRNTEPPPPLKKSIPIPTAKSGDATGKPLSEASRRSLEVGRTIISSVPPPAAKPDSAAASVQPPATTGTASQPAASAGEVDNTLETGKTIRKSLIEGKTIRESLVLGETIRATGKSPSVTQKPTSPNEDLWDKPTNASATASSEPTAEKNQEDADVPEHALATEDARDQLHSLSSSDEPDFSQVPATQDDDWTDSNNEIEDDEPDWTGVSSTMNAIPAFDEDLEAPPKRRALVYIVVFIVLLLGGGAAYLYFFQRDLLINQFGEVQDSKKIERQNTLLLEAREKVLLDTYSDFAQAEKKYLQVLAIDAHNPVALASLGQMYAIWAQYLLDSYLDASADAAAESTEQADQLKKEFENKLAAAERRVDEALKIDSELKEAHIAAAEINLLSGNLNGAKMHLKKGRSETTVRGTSYISAQIGIVENQNKDEVIGMLKSIVVADPLLRVLYRMARVQAADGKTDDALSSLQQILNLNKKHTAALLLKERVSSGKTIPLIPDDWNVADQQAADTDTEETAIDELNPAASASASKEGDDNDDDDDGGMSIDRMVQKAATAQENGRTQEAVDLYNRVLRESPNNVDALSGIAYTYLDKGNHGQAIAKFKRALDISPQFGPAIIGMAQAYKSMGQNAEALKWFQKYLDTNPNGRHAGMARRNVTALSDEVTAASPASSDTAEQNETNAATPAQSPSGKNVVPNADDATETKTSTASTASSASGPPPIPPTTPLTGSTAGAPAANTNTVGTEETPQ
ncbi:MAG: zinc-ribbon domain-containing protein [Deltaproteobacteria bacterium]|nr:zinc-ribbon domain-containing protein [Deltaproteobacteria bacterium]MBN2673779.1 zinc-ribbon domain-containing protein [Deltaproteobacteria bacterium]